MYHPTQDGGRLPVIASPIDEAEEQSWASPGPDPIGFSSDLPDSDTIVVQPTRRLPSLDQHADRHPSSHPRPVGRPPKRQRHQSPTNVNPRAQYQIQTRKSNSGKIVTPNRIPQGYQARAASFDSDDDLQGRGIASNQPRRLAMPQSQYHKDADIDALLNNTSYLGPHVQQVRKERSIVDPRASHEAPSVSSTSYGTAYNSVPQSGNRPEFGNSLPQVVGSSDRYRHSDESFPVDGVQGGISRPNRPIRPQTSAPMQQTQGNLNGNSLKRRHDYAEPLPENSHGYGQSTTHSAPSTYGAGTPQIEVSRPTKVLKTVHHATSSRNQDEAGTHLSRGLDSGLQPQRVQTFKPPKYWKELKKFEDAFQGRHADDPDAFPQFSANKYHRHLILDPWGKPRLHFFPIDETEGSVGQTVPLVPRQQPCPQTEPRQQGRRQGQTQRPQASIQLSSSSSPAVGSGANTRSDTRQPNPSPSIPASRGQNAPSTLSNPLVPNQGNSQSRNRAGRGNILPQNAIAPLRDAHGTLWLPKKDETQPSAVDPRYLHQPGPETSAQPLSGTQAFPLEVGDLDFSFSPVPRPQQAATNGYFEPTLAAPETTASHTQPAPLPELPQGELDNSSGHQGHSSNPRPASSPQAAVPSQRATVCDSTQDGHPLPALQMDDLNENEPWSMLPEDPATGQSIDDVLDASLRFAEAAQAQSHPTFLTQAEDWNLNPI